MSFGWGWRADPSFGGRKIMLGKALQPEIEELIEKRHFDELRELFVELEIPDVAEIVADLSPKDQAVVFRILPAGLAADVFEYLPLEDQEQLMHNLSMEAVGELLNSMAPDDRTRLLEELPGSVTQRLLKTLNPDELRIARTLLGYPDQSIGRLMTPDYVAVQPEWTIDQMMKHIRKVGIESETINVIYVIDPKGHLLDDIKLRQIVMADPDKRVEDLMNHSFTSLLATDDQEVAVAAFRKYDRTALPVTDSQGVLLGIVTLDDALEVAEEEATEDIQKLGGMEALDMPYMNVGLGEMIRKRAGWLVILFLGEMMTSTAMSYFEFTISKAVVLALFIPLIISSGGNSGSQAASLVIRALALGEITMKDWWAVVRRELLTGLALGFILGGIGFARVAISSLFTTMYGPHEYWVATTIAVTLVGVVTWGTLVGSMLPIILRRFGLDPAVSSAPFVATLVDVVGIVIYFSIAVLLLTGRVL